MGKKNNKKINDGGMFDAINRYAEARLQALEEEAEEREDFSINVQMPLGIIEKTLFSVLGSKDQKLISFYRELLSRASHQYGMRNVDFGDFKED